MKHVKLFETYVRESQAALIMGLPEFKDLIESSGYELISTPEEIAKLDFIFAFPFAYVVGEIEEDPDRLVGECKGYLRRGITVYKDSIPGSDAEEVCKAQIDLEDLDINEDASAKNTLANWKKLLIEAKESLQWWKDDYEKQDGFKMAITPEERKPLRGKATGQKFGF